MQSPRPRTVQSVFQVSLEIFRRNFLPFMGLAACFLLPFSIVSVYVQTHFLALSNHQLQQILTELQQQNQHPTTGLYNIIPIGMQIWFAVLGFVFVFLVCPLLYGAVAYGVAKSSQNPKFSFAEAGSASFSRGWANIGTSIVTGILFFVTCLVYTLILGLITGLVGTVSSALALVVGGIGTLFFVVGAIWFMMRISFVPLVVVLEGKLFFRAIGASWRATRRQMSRIAGFYLVLFVSIFASETLLTVILDIFFRSPGTQLVVGIVISMIFVPFALVCMCVMYFDVKLRQLN